jgi:predicted nucleic acid-binding protein
MISAVDTNVLLDVLMADERFMADSKSLLDEARSEGALVICEVVYAELACAFADRSRLRRFLQSTGIRLVPSTEADPGMAGEAWRMQLSRAQRTTSAVRIAADYMIGAHALGHADRLLTRDVGFYRACYPGLALNWETAAN